jgi:alpha-tubulin suppressor-like RCC1 family protein
MTHLKRTSSPNINLHNLDDPSNLTKNDDFGNKSSQKQDPKTNTEFDIDSKKNKQLITKISKIKCGDDYTYFIQKETGKIFACGSNKNNNLGFVGELRDTAGTVVLKPMATGLANISRIATEGHSTIMWNNKKRLYFYWGNNRNHKLGVDHGSEEVNKQFHRIDTSIESNTHTNQSKKRNNF